MTEADLVAAALAADLGGEVEGLERLLGGASRQTWSFRLDGRRLVLRRDPPGSDRSGEMLREAALLAAAAAAGVPVPAVVHAEPHRLVVEWLDGETIPRRILRDARYAEARSVLVGQCAAALAALHRATPPPAAALDTLEDPVGALRATLDRLGQPHPALELGLTRLEAARPAPVPATVVHGDFRLGNLMVGPSGLVGVLDWELAHLGDPAEDLGWMCVRSWRFGAAAPVAGLAGRDDLLAAYRVAGGGEVDLERLRWWETYGTLRWAVICLEQAAAHLTGRVRSVELAAIGRRVAEVELDLLELLAPDVVSAALRAPAAVAVVAPAAAQWARPPTLDDLVEAVQEWMDRLPLTGSDAFLARVSRRVLDVVRREAALGPGLRAVHEQRLAALRVRSDEELAEQVRAGRDGADVVRALVDAAVDRLRVDDPGQLADRAG